MRPAGGFCEGDGTAGQRDLSKNIKKLLTNDKFGRILVAQTFLEVLGMEFLDKHEKTLTKVATVLSKIVEVAYFVGAVILTVGFVLVLVDPAAKLPALAPGEEFAIRGFSIVCGSLDGTVDRTAFGLVLLEGALTMELMAWVFRNAYLILRTSQGLTKFSKGPTPFQKDNVRMLREIGIFFISMTVVKFIMSAVAVAVLGPETAEVSADFGDALVGLLVLFLSQCFAQGVRMQQDVDGLV